MKYKGGNHPLDHLAILPLFPSPYKHFLCDSHKNSRRGWYEHFMAFCFYAGQLFFSQYFAQVMLCILSAILAIEIYLVGSKNSSGCLLDLTLCCIRELRVILTQSIKQNLYVKKLKYHYQLEFPQFRRVWCLPILQNINQRCYPPSKVHIKVIIPTFYFLSYLVNHTNVNTTHAINGDCI